MIYVFILDSYHNCKSVTKKRRKQKPGYRQQNKRRRLRRRLAGVVLVNSSVAGVKKGVKGDRVLKGE